MLCVHSSFLLLLGATVAACHGSDPAGGPAAPAADPPAALGGVVPAERIPPGWRVRRFEPSWCGTCGQQADFRTPDGRVVEWWMGGWPEPKVSFAFQHRSWDEEPGEFHVEGRLDPPYVLDPGRKAGSVRIRFAAPYYDGEPWEAELLVPPRDGRPDWELVACVLELRLALHRAAIHDPRARWEVWLPPWNGGR